MKIPVFWNLHGKDRRRVLSEDDSAGQTKQTQQSLLVQTEVADNPESFLKGDCLPPLCT